MPAGRRPSARRGRSSWLARRAPTEGWTSTICCGASLEAGPAERLPLFVAPMMLGRGRAWTDAPDVDEMADVLGFSFRAPRLLGGDLLVEAVADAKRAQKR